MRTLSFFIFILLVWVVFEPEDFGERAHKLYSQILKGWVSYE